MNKFNLLRKSLLLCGILLLSILTAQAATRPTFSDTPFGFANVGGDFSGLIPTCGSTPVVRVTSSTDLTNEIASAGTTKKIIIVAPGNYNAITIKDKKNLSIIGEDGADIAKIAIQASSTNATSSTTQNILIRNIAITRYTVDGLSATGGRNIWIDHCTIGWLTTSPVRDSPDGAMDMTNYPDYVTVSWCKFQNTWKFGLLGSGDSDLANRHVTWYCNYVVNTFQRTPRIRSGETHIINCLYENSGWCRPQSMTGNEFTLQETAGYTDDGEYLKDRRVVSIGYAIMAAYKANVIVENNFFYDVRWAICASRPRPEFELKYGDMQSPDINNKTNSGCIACKQIGNDYDDSGLLSTMKIKDANVSSALCGTMIAPLSYEYTYNSETRWVIKPSMLNPGERSIKFDEFAPELAFDPTSYTGYYPSGFTPLTAQETRNLVSQYAGAGTVQFCPTGAAPTLSTPSNKDQANVEPITDIIFTWGGGATDAKIFDLPLGLTVTKNTAAKTLTISGTPTTSSTYTVMTEGGTGSAIVVTGTITSKPAISCSSLLKVSITNLATAGTYKLVLFNAAGTTQIEVLTESYFSTGNTDFSFMQATLAAGTYTYKLMSGASTIQSGTLSIP